MKADETARLAELSRRVDALERCFSDRKSTSQRLLEFAIRAGISSGTIAVARSPDGTFAPSSAGVTAGDMNRAYGTRRIIEGLLRGANPQLRAKILGRR